MDLRRGVRGFGKSLIAAGLLILLFVAYQLWGTGLAESRSQRRLTRQFVQELRSSPTDAPAAGPSRSAAPPPPAPSGEAVAIIEIPRIDVVKAVVQGVTLPVLKKGPGHYPTTPLPGQPGNAAIAGHRTTYGAPFFSLDRLTRGDPVLVTTRQGRFRYRVTENKVVGPDETSVLDPTPDNRLTLTTCHPRFSASERLVVVAALEGEAAQAPPPAPPPTPERPRPEVVAAERPGLSGERAPNGPAIAWGVAAVGVGVLVLLVGRWWRRWPAYLLGAPAFLVVLFFFFENFSRLLPANF